MPVPGSFLLSPDWAATKAVQRKKEPAKSVLKIILM
jgi:hypothetical protein